MRVEMNNEFDLKAAGWDSNPVHLERAEAIAGEIRKMVEIKPGMKGFEYGCGTGLLSFNLAGFLKSIVLADSSAGMLDIVKEKIMLRNLNNMTPLLIDLEKEPVPNEKFDIVYTQMTLHHVKKLDPVISGFYDMLYPGGFICIADLYREDGSFHGKGFEGHKGFDPEELKTRLEAPGFKSVKYKKSFEMKRNIEGNEKSFPLFIITGQK